MISAIFFAALSLYAELEDKTAIWHPFDLTGEVLQYYRGKDEEWNIEITTPEGEYFLKDMSAATGLAPHAGLDDYRCLDRVHFTGRIFEGDKPGDRQYLGFLRAERLERGNTAEIPELGMNRFYDPAALNRLHHLRGLVRGAERDDTDPHYAHFRLNTDGKTVHVFLQIGIHEDFDPVRYLGAELRFLGVLRNYTKNGLRRQLDYAFSVSSLKDVEVISPPPDFGKAPPASELAAGRRAIAASGLVVVRGVVEAVWGGDAALLKSEDGKRHRVSFLMGGLPAVGETVEALGIPVTDFYRLDLLHARWRATSLPRQAPEPAEEVSPGVLYTHPGGRPQLMVTNLGRALAFTGIVRYLPGDVVPERRFFIEVDGELVPIDISAEPALADGLVVGCRVRVGGVCIVNADNWNAETAAEDRPRYFLVPRNAADIVVLSRPSWWTSGRLTAAIALLFSALVMTVIWNRALDRRSRRKGEELAKERLAHLASDFKVGERTRLSVELHDALSQMLTGVSMQIDTAAAFAAGSPAIDRCLGLASRTVDACRTELRNVLWDLRSSALDEPDMNTAIRRTLLENLAGVELSVRFNVPRPRLRDDLAHAVLRIIRELASNAIRHGRAKKLWIAGTLEGETLEFSVRDDGCGFDPAKAPGVAEGHFGLQGVTERIARLGGRLGLESSPGAGTRAVVSLPLSPALKC